MTTDAVVQDRTATSTDPVTLLFPNFRPTFVPPPEGAAGAEAEEEASGTPHGPAQHGGPAQTHQDTEGGRTGPSGRVAVQPHQ